MLVYQDIVSGDEMLSDSFPYTEIENGVLWEVEGKWVVQGHANVDEGGDDEGGDDEGGDDEGDDDQAIRVVDIVDTFSLQEHPPVDRKLFIVYVKKYIKSLQPYLEGESLQQFNDNIDSAIKYLLGKLDGLQLFIGESMVDDAGLVFAYYKDGAADPTFLYFAHGLKEVEC